MKKQQRGGTIIGFILGVIVGLGAALAVAVYVTKVPVPFLNKGGARGADQDAAEAEKNRNWDPNQPLYGKSAARAAAAAAAAPASAAVAAASAPKGAASKPDATAGKSSADPLGDLAKAKLAAATAASPEGADYFVQAGSFNTQASADAQRAKLAMLGWESRVSEREQNGRTVFRVRVGPFSKLDDASQLKEKLTAAGVESVLVSVKH